MERREHRALNTQEAAAIYDEVVSMNERLAKLETKMNIISYVAGATFAAVALTLITGVLMHLRLV